MTRGRRRAMTGAYMPDGSIFSGKKSILPQSYLSALKPGDLLQNDEFLPRVFP